MNYGGDEGKFVVVVDICNGNTVLVDGPTTSFPRVVYPLRRLTLTNLRLPILRGARTGTVKKAAEKYELNKKIEASSVGKKNAARAVRANLTDIDRFKVMINRKNRSYVARKLAKKMLGGGKKGAKGGKGGKKK